MRSGRKATARSRITSAGSLFDPGSTIASRIANEFNEAIGPQLNALMALGCILFLVTFTVLVLARLLVSRVKVG